MEYDGISVSQEKLVAFVICGIAKPFDTYTYHSHNVDRREEGQAI
jgi:hypothetical protein